MVNIIPREKTKVKMTRTMEENQFTSSSPPKLSFASGMIIHTSVVANVVNELIQILTCWQLKGHLNPWWCSHSFSILTSENFSSNEFFSVSCRYWCNYILFYSLSPSSLKEEDSLAAGSLVMSILMFELSTWCDIWLLLRSATLFRRLPLYFRLFFL